MMRLKTVFPDSLFQFSFIGILFSPFMLFLSLESVAGRRFNWFFAPLVVFTRIYAFLNMSTTCTSEESAVKFVQELLGFVFQDESRVSGFVFCCQLCLLLGGPVHIFYFT